jgi:pSer/pThr/pTyr-binding forkhead associated (FHA) protein
MQLILKPISHPDLGEIIVSDSLFAIGRHEAPFSDYEPSLVAKLSRRHARIFEQDGLVYIADLGSLNGTTVNGGSVEKIPVRLQSGDELCVTGLCYQVEILGTVAHRELEEPASPPVRLVLVPAHPGAGIEPIVVSQFPFLVNKTSEVFERYKDTLPEEVQYISRRHAHIFVRDQSLYIEDLGSTNGTFISGQRLEEHARRLQTGDLVAFGGDRFVYRVELVYEDEQTGNESPEPSQLTDRIEGIDDVTRTTFVTSANSFLDIYCAEDENARDVDNEAAAGVESHAQSAAIEAKRGPGRWRHIIKEVRGALADDKDSRPAKRWIAALVLVTAVVAALGVYFTGEPKREIEDLVREGAYAEAAAAANRYLEKHPDDRDISALATEAIMKSIVPSWMEFILSTRFDEAKLEIERGQRLNQANPSAGELFEVMQWAADLEQFMVDRGGPDAPIVMFEQEDRIRELLAWWETDAEDHRRSLGAVSQHVPEFAPLRAQVFSHLRTLQSQKSLDITAIDRLLAKVEEKLEAGDAESLYADFSEFERRYPRISGVAALQDDLDSYLLIDTHIQSRDWIEAHRGASKVAFQTPPFRQRMAVLARDVLPPESIASRYQQAFDAWRSGELDKANGLLEALQDERWGEPAGRRLEKNRALIDEFDQLKRAKGSDGYEQQLIAFYLSLNPEQDRYFVDALEDEFQAHREKALARAEKAFVDAEQAWASYQANGGIRGLHRLEAGVSPTFRRLAAELSDAYQHITEGVHLYQLLDTPYPPAWDELYARILNEVRLQRRSLAELAMVLEPSLKKAKLDLIPDLQVQELEQAPAGRPTEQQ